jgi:ribosome maturation factor RimP
MLPEQSIEKVKAKVQAIAAQVAVQEGCYLYDLEFTGRVLQVFIDKEGGAGIEDCSNISKGLNLALDTEDPIPGGAYNLEVSTPGLERSLKLKWHFDKVVGKKIWIKTDKTLETFGVTDGKIKSAKQLSEVLMAASEESIQFKVGEVSFSIPYSDVVKAKLVIDIEDKGQKNPPKGKKKGKR